MRAPHPEAAAVRALVDELYLATDAKDWPRAEALFAPAPMRVDMTSLIGGEPLELTPAQLFAGFRTGLHAGKLSHHMTSNMRIEIEGDVADIVAHGYAWNHVPSLPDGENLWETWGVYRLTARRTAAAGWRLTSFAYTSRLTRGPDAVRTHVP